MIDRFTLFSLGPTRHISAFAFATNLVLLASIIIILKSRIFSVFRRRVFYDRCLIFKTGYEHFRIVIFCVLITHVQIEISLKYQRTYIYR